MSRKPKAPKRPKGRKYMNLIVHRGERGPIIYYVRIVDGRKRKVSTRTADWDRAAEFRDQWETKREGDELAAHGGRVPAFRDAVADYLATEAQHLAPTTRRDRGAILGPNGSLMRWFADRRVDEIGRRDVIHWWEKEIESSGLSVSTGRNYLDALSGVIGRVEVLYDLDRNPVAEARRFLSQRRKRTKLGRAADQRAQDTRTPIERTEELAAFVQASGELWEEAMKLPMHPRRDIFTGRWKRLPRLRASLDGHVVDMILLDAGMRIGEACALKWGDIEMPEDPSQPRRIHVRRSFSRGQEVGPPKNGRERTVQLSRRLAGILRRRWERDGRPDATVWVFPSSSTDRDLPGIDPSNYTQRHFVHVCKRAAQILEERRARAAGVEPQQVDPMRWKPKDLRDTFASQLLTAGVQLAYISTQLGHSNVEITASTYAKWTAADAYREPIRLRAGEVPADLLMRIGEPSQTAVAQRG